MFADMAVGIFCNACPAMRQMHAYNVVQLLREKRKIDDVKLGIPVGGFYCKRCRRSVTVTIRAPAQWA